MLRRNQSKAQRYSRQKYALSLLETAFVILLLYILAVSGLSSALTVKVHAVFPGGFFATALFLLIIGLGYYILSFPINIYRSFIIEHRFGLSAMRLNHWLIDQVKSGAISYIIALIIVSTFYLLLRLYPRAWWIHVSFFWVFFTLFLAQLTPLIIIPLFFKYRPLEDETLRSRILALGEKMKVPFLDVYEINMSAKTHKANAAFVGWGRTKRVLLADTLQKRYDYDEIEMILAHEFAHYKHKHLLKLIAIDAAVTIGVFYFIYATSGSVLARFGYQSLSDLAALPLVFLYFQIFSVIAQPAHAFISRRMEHVADATALKVTQKKSAFISMMEKLAQQNLADIDPHPLVKFFFFDHPPISERIQMAEKFQPAKPA